MEKNFPITSYNLEEMDRYQAILAGMSAANDSSIHNFLNCGTLIHGSANLFFSSIICTKSPKIHHSWEQSLDSYYDTIKRKAGK